MVLLGVVDARDDCRVCLIGGRGGFFLYDFGGAGSDWFVKLRLSARLSLSSASSGRARAALASKMAGVAAVETFVVRDALVSFFFGKFLGLKTLDVSVRKVDVGFVHGGAARSWSSRLERGGTSMARLRPQAILLVEGSGFIDQSGERGWQGGNSRKLVI